MYYLFSPLMEDGKQVVRRLGDKEWGDVKDIDPELCGPRHQRDDCIGIFYTAYPILTVKQFEEDPLIGLKQIYNEYKDMLEPGGHPLCAMRMWQAIVKVVERLEGK